MVGLILGISVGLIDGVIVVYKEGIGVGVTSPEGTMTACTGFAMNREKKITRIQNKRILYYTLWSGGRSVYLKLEDSTLAT